MRKENICVPAKVKVVFEVIVSNSETASEGPIAEYHSLILCGESNKCPCFHINAVTDQKYPLYLCV